MDYIQIIAAIGFLWLAAWCLAGVLRMKRNRTTARRLREMDEAQTKREVAAEIKAARAKIDAGRLKGERGDTYVPITRTRFTEDRDRHHSE